MFQAANSKFTFRTMLAGVLSLVVCAAASAQSRSASTPEAVFDRFLDGYERVVETTASKLESQLETANTNIERLIARNASDAQLTKAVNTAATTLAKTVRSAASSVIKSATSTRKTLAKMQSAAERRGDDETADEAASYIDALDRGMAFVNASANEAIQSLSGYRQQLANADDFESEYDEVTESIVEEIEAFIESL